MCVQSTLLGFDCLVKEQCSMKVANSICLHGSCRCDSGYLQFRRHTCLSPASPGDVCYSDAHCRLWDSDTHCDFLIPNLFGRCQCNPPMQQRGRSCFPSTIPTGDGNPSASSVDSPNTSSVWGLSPSATDWHPLSTSSLTSSGISTPRPTEPPVPSRTSSQNPLASSSLNNFPMDESSLSTQAPASDETHSTMFSRLPPLTQYTSEDPAGETTFITTPSTLETSSEDQNQLSQSLQETQTPKPEMATIDTHSFIPLSNFSTPSSETLSELLVSVAMTTQQYETQEDTSEILASEQSTTMTILQEDSLPSASEVTSPLPMASTVVWTRVRGVGESVAVTLGLTCVSDLQCQIADPGSRCLDGVCDCVIKNDSYSCGVGNTGCYKGTFQCRSTGVCISWFFVCDGRQDCPDGSDEGCQDTKSCPPQAFRCGQNGGCVSRAGRCDGTPDCPGAEDELHCNATRSAKGCPERTYRCLDGSCLPEYEFCNAMVKCRDGSDEPRDACKARTNRRTSGYCPFRCANGRCRSDAIACSGRDGCGDGSDEAHCSVCRCPVVPSGGRISHR
ncbi:Low-density lipoprotein receptor-related protein [Zootermopsis nevadensis]|uniref:Low-density lipoprotein receptor-related protein n=2 Tax=Zootermopsis nevadensis TaxID=136037 RepID=A0A067RA40_ZOONE|nr:Low-density lipoprotein receptor-related protein [Zootermopsis nevadensis]